MECTSYELHSEYLLALGCNSVETARMTYVEHQDVRHAAAVLVEELLSRYGRELFSGICGRCGQCCRSRTVMVSAREITAISRHLDISETQCRESCTVPSATWNEHDGALASKDGTCIFLQQGSSGACTCTIYQVRPSSCRELMPPPECCSKDPGKLLTCLERLEIRPEALTCHLASGGHYRIEREDAHLEDCIARLSLAVEPCLGNAQSQIEEMSSDAHRLLDWVLHNYESGVSREILLPRFAAIKGIVDDIDTLTLMREQAPSDLEMLWRKTRHLEKLFAPGSREAGETPPGNPAGSGDEAPAAICFHPTFLTVEIASPQEPLMTTLHYHQHEKLLGFVRQFIEALVAAGEPGLVDVLEHGEPSCFMCGVCCGSYDLEATALDIERLADYLKISEREVWETCLVPGARSWNRRDGLLRRLRKEHYEGECIFLKKKSPTESVCGIYEGRPRICRDYQANTRLCKKQSLVLRGYEHTGNIISCHVSDDMLRLTTHHTCAQGTEPFTMALDDYDTLREKFRHVKTEVIKILGIRINA